ncbi:FMN-binding negative transcriptional regulator [Alteriqipengyuania flavescens]|uniref:FMN-binding negative transcriptional regulator n=1 Tax=Alteriqipengyuania flavescens TaxID=3053610 RepID=UPI0025B49CFD|nr:FMN-binding negative transcriptional regulator [Alteriqipengyuania flavescens]WJY19146.1 FMN-binding negative transcriptional regulator [Alteriqipengyuania flavescens]WJY25086.1 FMN-binding negative transcriptional regulator [Alteriqipengyuania flavescens]
MHPNPAFRRDERALHEALIDQVGFGTVFLTTPDGPRVAHTPLVSTGDGAVQFHLARANALTRHLPGATALAVVNGPDAYVSSRWYDDPNKVPTWNYVAIELEGPVRQMEEEGLLGLLETLSSRHEGRIATGGKPWTMDKLTPQAMRAPLRGIVGFEMEVMAWRETVKLSQNQPADERERVAAALEAEGSLGVAELMRTLP